MKGKKNFNLASLIEENASNHPAEPEMVFVQGGTFMMGTPKKRIWDESDDDERPVHQVTVSDFYIGKYVVTQEQWKAVMDNNPSHFLGEKLPVESVSWDDVQVFINKLSSLTGKKYRLPTEAEWEFAARGGNKSKGYIYSGSTFISDVAWFLYNSDHKTHPVGTRYPNELGIYDMSGNVAEWCSDWYGEYCSNAQTNPQGPLSDPGRVNRGCGYTTLQTDRAFRVATTGIPSKTMTVTSASVLSAVQNRFIKGKQALLWSWFIQLSGNSAKQK